MASTTDSANSCSTLQKIRILGQQGKFDICASTASNRTNEFPDLFKGDNTWVGATAAGGICHSYTPDGRCVSLFKVLFTNRCIYSCKYCFTQVSREKASFTPEEYASTFMKLYSMNVAEGVFLSSAICGDADETTKQMLEAVKILRFKYHFRGYIHFKCLPGTSAYLLKEATMLSDRISINLEAPTKEFLSEIADQKNFNTDIITRQRWLNEIKISQNHNAEKLLAEQGISLAATDDMNKAPKPLADSTVGEWHDDFGQVRRSNGYLKVRWEGGAFMHSGQTTQFCLGAAGESDFDLLKRLDWEYKEVDLRRGYFSAFSPIPGTPLEEIPATPLEREHRLYQTDWLLRIYHIPLKTVKEILNSEGNLPSGDPKIHIARNWLADEGRIEVNKATYPQLLKIPGIGPIAAKRIASLIQQHHTIQSRSELQKMGVVLKRAEPFITLNGVSQSTIDFFIGGNFHGI